MNRPVQRCRRCENVSEPERSRGVADGKAPANLCAGMFTTGSANLPSHRSAKERCTSISWPCNNRESPWEAQLRNVGAGYQSCRLNKAATSFTLGNCSTRRLADETRPPQAEVDRRGIDGSTRSDRPTVTASSAERERAPNTLGDCFRSLPLSGYSRRRRLNTASTEGHVVESVGEPS